MSPATLYHVTGRPNVAAILTEGLRTDAMGWDAGYVWGFDSVELALELARTTRAWGGHRDLVVLELDATGLEVVPDPHPGWGDDRDRHAWAIPASVPPERLELVA